MANIQQAAKWLYEGKQVARENWGEFRLFNENGNVKFGSKYTMPLDYPFGIDDLLAQDWKEFNVL